LVTPATCRADDHCRSLGVDYASPGSLTDAFNAVANSDQPTYGPSAAAATRSWRARSASCAATTTSRTAITASDARLSRMVKNTSGHSAFSDNCVACNAHVRRPGRRCSIRQPAKPIEAYSSVHTGPNTPLGGAHPGLT